MTIFHLLAATTLATVGVLHSVLGERVIIRPLIDDTSWQVPFGRSRTERVLRFAWHVTTLAWFGLAATVLGVAGPVAVTAVAFVSALLVLPRAPAHLSWPLFLLTALWAALAAELITSTLLTAVVAVTAVTAVAAAVIHLVWATGRARGSAAAALPTTKDGTAVLAPSGVATVAVAVALLTYAGALTLLTIDPVGWLPRVVVAGATVILFLRAAGDGRYVGFSKRLRSTRFARLDDVVYTPVVAALAIGGAAGLAL